MARRRRMGCSEAHTHINTNLHSPVFFLPYTHAHAHFWHVSGGRRGRRYNNTIQSQRAPSSSGRRRREGSQSEWVRVCAREPSLCYGLATVRSTRRSSESKTSSTPTPELAEASVYWNPRWSAQATPSAVVTALLGRSTL